MKPRTIREIIQSIKNELQSAGSVLGNFSDYTNIYQIVRAIAAVIAEQEVLINQHNNSFYINTAQGLELDRRASDFGLIRKQGTPSSGHVLAISNTNKTINLPKGIVLTHAPTRFQFETAASSSITSNRESLILINGLNTTPNANLEAGTKLYSITYPNIEFIVGKYRNSSSKTIEGNLTFGQIAETDDQFRVRISNYISSLAKGTLQSLEASILTVPSISKVFIKEHLPTSGYATAYVNTRNESVLRQVRNVISSNKPAGIAILVKPLKLVEVHIELVVTITNPSFYNQVVSQTKTILNNLFDGLTVGEGLTRRRILSILDRIPNNQSVLLRSPSSDISINNDETLVISHIEVDVLIDNNAN